MWELEAYPKDGIYWIKSYEVRGITEETVQRIVEYWGEDPPVWARENPVPDQSVSMLIPFIDEPFVQRPDWDYFLGARAE